MIKKYGYIGLLLLSIVLGFFLRPITVSAYEDHAVSPKYVIQDNLKVFKIACFNEYNDGTPITCSYDVANNDFPAPIVIKSMDVYWNGNNTSLGSSFFYCNDYSTLYRQFDSGDLGAVSGSLTIGNADMYCGQSFEFVNYSGNYVITFSYYEATTTPVKVQDAGNVSFALAIIITILSFLLLGFMFNAISGGKKV